MGNLPRHNGVADGTGAGLSKRDCDMAAAREARSVVAHCASLGPSICEYKFGAGGSSVHGWCSHGRRDSGFSKRKDNSLTVSSGRMCAHVRAHTFTSLPNGLPVAACAAVFGDAWAVTACLQGSVDELQVVDGVASVCAASVVDDQSFPNTRFCRGLSWGRANQLRIRLELNESGGYERVHLSVFVQPAIRRQTFDQHDP
ncbi:hypothetical protein ON010_g8402 [Phytophthora cinnamomi]|nr:hypothetical protein ON010_g8402 [Phytophthora cinnamomi]